MKYLLVLFPAFFLMHSISDAQDSAKPLPFESRLVGALFNKQVQGELELVEDQQEELKEILGSLKKKQDELGRELTEFKNSGASEAEVESKRQDFVAGFEIDKQQTMSRAMNVLLPHQQKRLRQVAVQLMSLEAAKKERIPTGILTPEIREHLEIDGEQAERLKTKATELQKQLAEKIKALTEQAQAELLGELTEDQKAKYKELVGDPIKR